MFLQNFGLVHIKIMPITKNSFNKTPKTTYWKNRDLLHECIPSISEYKNICANKKNNQKLSFIGIP